MENRIPCKKCLLSDIEPGEELEKIKKLIELMPETEKAENDEYLRRLTLCKICEKLSSGTCIACGCYVELRAIKKKNHCPDKHW